MTPSIFLRIIDGKLILWDYFRHAQYEIGLPHLARLVSLSAIEEHDTTLAELASIDAAIRASQVLDDPEPEAWEWDCLARIFHVGSQIMHSGVATPRVPQTTQAAGAAETPDAANTGTDVTDVTDATNATNATDATDATNATDTPDAYQGYVDYCASIVDRIPEMHIELPGEAMALPAPALDSLARISLWDALIARRTCREFHARSIDLSRVSTALWATFGAVHGAERTDLLECGLMPVGYRRTSPSGGSLHPSEPYLVALRVDGLAPGVYHYRSRTHALTRVAPAPEPGRLGSMLCAQTFAEDLAYGIFVVSRFDKMWWKYPHSRAYRVALFDIGCLIQTFQLTCAAQGIQSWPTGYFVDHEINRWLELDDAKHSVMFFLGAGIGSGSVAREALAAIHGPRRGH